MEKQSQQSPYDPSSGSRSRKIKQFTKRVLNFVRPQPRSIALNVHEIAKSSESLDVIQRFNDLYYSTGVSGSLNWCGLQMLKNPCDLWMVLELLQKLKPSVLIETGTHHGGSASFYADMCKVFGISCDIITVDINPKWAFDPKSKGIHSVVGYSTDANVVNQVKTLTASFTSRRPGAVMVMLDSDHSEENVRAELALYSPLVTVGSYLIVEDTNVNGHPSSFDHGPGPYEAAEKFLAENKQFVVDLECQKYLLTYNPNGWLKRIK